MKYVYTIHTFKYAGYQRPKCKPRYSLFSDDDEIEIRAGFFLFWIYALHQFNLIVDKIH